jgi:hypothetical protein
MDVAVTDKMLINCLLLNRQFKEEYERLIGSRQTLIFTDINYNLARVELQGVIKKTSNVKLRLLMLCYDENAAYDECNCSADVNYNTKWIKNTLEQLCGLKSVKFELHPCHRSDQSGASHRHTKEAIDKLQAVIRLQAKVEVEVYPSFGYEDDENDDVLEAYKDKGPLQGKWTRDEGWLSS